MTGGRVLVGLVSPGQHAHQLVVGEEVELDGGGLYVEMETKVREVFAITEIESPNTNSNLISGPPTVG